MGAPVEHINTMLAVSDSRWTRRHHQGQSARSTTLEREPSPGGASYDTLSSARPQNKKEWPTGRDVPPHHVEHSSTAANAHERLGRSPIGPGPDRLLQAARTLAVKKSEKPAEHRYKLSSADIAVVTVRRLPPMSERVEGFGCRPIAAMRLAPWPASESLQ